MALGSGDTSFAELKDLLVGYAKQETVDPVKSLARYVAWGLAGSLAMSLGVIFLALGVLRLLQTQTGSALDGNWSFVPYLLTLLAVAVGLALCGLAVSRVRHAEKTRNSRSMP